ncbi:MAG: diguanylate cyclase [Planctomycetota bacterium]
MKSADNDRGKQVRPVLRQSYRGTHGLQFRTTLLLTCIVMVATGLTGVTYLRLSSQIAFSQTRRHAKDLASSLAAAGAVAVEQRDQRALLALAESVVPQGDLAYVVFTDQVGDILAGHQRGEGRIMPLLLAEGGSRLSVEPIDQPMLNSSGGVSHIDIVLPITSESARESLDMPPATIGYVRLGVGLSAAEASLADLMRKVIGLAIGITLLMVPLGYEVIRKVVGPINRLADAAGMVARGDLTARVELKSRTEIGNLARSFNSMADELANSHGKLVKLNAELEDRVMQRTRELEEANRQLSEMAVRDSLTGLFNRRHFNNLLTQLFAEARRYQTDLTCMMLDLDNFKQANDSLGHHTGDQLLQMAALAIVKTIRESDVAVRYGGDEFVVLLPQTSPVDARALAERLLRQFRTDLVNDMPQANIVTLSIGLASREKDQPKTAVDLVNLADEALYLAKAGGKNRITVVRPVAAGGVA